MELVPTALSGCFEIKPRVFTDNRGQFVKTFHKELFAQANLATEYVEQFYSHSRQGVLRGLHFQTPPRDHAKLVFCVAGDVLDAVVDLRAGSPTYGRHIVIQLSAGAANMIYVPSGMAHGFYTLSSTATMVYNTTSVHAPEHDGGIRWDSAGIRWPGERPIVSPRDAAFPALADFQTPFTFRGAA